MKIELIKEKTEKKALTKYQKDILKSVGCESIEVLKELFVASDPDSDTTEALKLVLEGLGVEVPRVFEGISSEGISSKGTGSEMEAEEYLNAAGKVEEEEARSEEGESLKGPWAVEEEETEKQNVPEEKKQNRIQQVWADIKKLFE